MDLFLPAVVALNWWIMPSLSSCILCDTLTDPHSRGARTVRSRVLVSVVTPSTPLETPPPPRPPLLIAPSLYLAIPRPTRASSMDRSRARASWKWLTRCDRASCYISTAPPGRASYCSLTSECAVLAALTLRGSQRQDG